MRGGRYADLLPVLQVPENKADAVPYECLQNIISFSLARSFQSLETAENTEKNNNKSHRSVSVYRVLQMRGGGYADVLPVLQVLDNKADAVPCEASIAAANSSLLTSSVIRI